MQDALALSAVAAAIFGLGVLAGMAWQGWRDERAMSRAREWVVRFPDVDQLKRTAR